MAKKQIRPRISETEADALIILLNREINASQTGDVSEYKEMLKTLRAKFYISQESRIKAALDLERRNNPDNPLIDVLEDVLIEKGLLA